MSQSVCVFITSLDSEIFDDTLVKLWIFHIVTLNWSILMKSCVVWIVFWVSKVSFILFVGRSSHFLRRGVNSFIPTPLNSFWGRVRRSHLKNFASLHRNRPIFSALTLKFFQLSDKTVIWMNLNKTKTYNFSFNLDFGVNAVIGHVMVLDEISYD